MTSFDQALRRSIRPASLLLAAATACQAATAQTAAAPRTLELLLTRGQLSAGQPGAHAAGVNGTWAFDDGQVARVEVLNETKFGARGGIVAGSFTRVFSPEVYATGTLALGHGGPNWARQRIDLDLATKWGASRQIVTHLAINGARFDDQRSDGGLRATVVAYLPGSTVVEGGVLFNVSQPGAVHSRMPFASVTWGRPGEQFLSLRLSSGSEAYQALGNVGQLVDFHSTSLGLTWRRWLGPRWGVIATAETYRNPTYRRHTAGAGLLVQF